jgi:type II secretory pathway component GspD/PulD (secretin)
MFQFRTFFSALFFLSTSSIAADFNFKDVPVDSFVHAVKHHLDRNVIVSPAVLGVRITFSASIPDNATVPAIKTVLMVHGVCMQDGEHLIVLLPKQECHESKSTISSELFTDNSDAFVGHASEFSSSVSRDTLPLVENKNLTIIVYRPKYRSVSFLSKVVAFAGATVLPVDTASVLVYGYDPENPAIQARVTNALNDVDFPEKSVYLHVVFIELSSSSSKGFTLSGLFKTISGRFSVDFGSPGSGVNLAVKGASIDAVLSLLDETNKYRYLAEPSLSVIDGREAKLIVGSDVPLRGSVGRDSSGVTLQSVTYKQTGLQMSIKPSIYDDYVVFDSTFEVSSFSQNSASDIDSPLILRRSISSSFPLRQGEVILLGGLSDGRTTDSESGFLGLPFGRRNGNDVGHILVLAEIVKLDGAVGSGDEHLSKDGAGADAVVSDEGR